MGKSAKGQTIPKKCTPPISETCLLRLKRGSLLVLREERRREVIFKIPLSDIELFSRRCKSAATGEPPADAQAPNWPEIVALRFYYPCFGTIELIFEMLPLGENNIVKAYQRRQKRRELSSIRPGGALGPAKNRALELVK